MIVSLNWLKKFISIDMSVDKLATLIGARLVEIEEVIGLGEKYVKIVAVKVISAEKLTGSDHLSLTKIDDGGVTPEVERDENGLVQVVCGAPNIRAGQTVVWLPPGAIVPETYAGEKFVLGSRKLCGAMSNGMIASARELDLFDEHDGILVIDDEIAAGTPFAEAYALDDYLLDIENKSLTHRPDCFGIIGFAREVAAIQGRTFVTPDWLKQTKPIFGEVVQTLVELNVAIDDASLASRYQAVVLSGADCGKASPLEVQTYLARVGIRPINAVVDVTNYLMMLTGQPLHAFDYDKVVSVGGGRADIHVRAGVEGEKLTLLDDRTIELNSEDIIIAAGQTAIGLAGAMGGANTEIDENTKNIIIESATFNLYNLRATQMRHGIFSEAITRFTKGQPADLTAPVLFKATELMARWSGAERVSEVAQAYPMEIENRAIEVSEIQINDILGTNFSLDQIKQVLKNTEFDLEMSSDEKLKVTAPYWRADINIVEDIAEEIGRLNGFDNIQPVLPLRDFVAVRPNGFDIFRGKLRKILVDAGTNEVLNYSFIHGDIVKKVGQQTENSYRITNSISPDLQYYRQSLTPSMLNLVHSNIKQGYDKFALFEINKIHKKSDGLNDEAVPVESEALSLVVANKVNQAGAPYYQAKYLLDYLSLRLGIKIVYKSIEVEPKDEPMLAPFEYRRSALVLEKNSSKVIGVVGEYKKPIVKSFKLPEFVAGFELDTKMMFEIYHNAHVAYKKLSKYPSTDRDICFRVDENIAFKQIIDCTEAALGGFELESIITPVDIYQTEGSTMKNITIRVNLVSYNHTLVGDEITKVVEAITAAVLTKTNAEII